MKASQVGDPSAGGIEEFVLLEGVGGSGGLLSHDLGEMAYTRIMYVGSGFEQRAGRSLMSRRLLRLSRGTLSTTMKELNCITEHYEPLRVPTLLQCLRYCPREAWQLHLANEMHASEVSWVRRKEQAGRPSNAPSVR